MGYAETCGLHEEQWGFRSNRTSTDAAAQKVLTFEYGRYMKFMITLFANDQTVCFDRMILAFTNIITQANGATKQELLCRSKTIAAIKRYTKMGLGVSKRAYKNQPGRPQIQEEI